MRRMLECKKKNKLGERGEICLHVKQISRDEEEAVSLNSD